MPSNKSMKQMQKDSTAASSRHTAALTKSGRKAPGTRLGILEDWRGDSNKSGKTSGRIGKSVRDGR
jgi:hypothetical protein